MKNTKKICIAGKNNIAVDIAQFVNNKYHDYDLLILVNGTDKGHDGWQKSLKKFAINNKIPIVSLADIYPLEDLIFLSLEFDKIINTKKFNTKYLYNLHFSNLPKYKGMYTSVWPLLNGENTGGVTLHEINNGIDTGLIIDQYKFTINENDTSRDLYFKYLKYGTNIVKTNLSSLLVDNKVNKSKQSAYSSSYFSKSSIDFKNIKIDLRKTAYEIKNQLRAFTFREYQLPKVYKNYIFGSKITDDASICKPGMLLGDNDISILISTVDYDLILFKDNLDYFFKACKYGDIATIKMSFSNTNNLNMQNNLGWTKLIVAIYNNQKEAVKLLLEKGADINITNFKGTTALMYAKDAAINNNDLEILNILKNQKLNLFQKDYSGFTVLDYCLRDGNYDVHDLLIREYQ